MGKKKKKLDKELSPEEIAKKKRKRKRKKLIRLLTKLFIALVVGLVGYALYNPNVIKNEQQREALTQARQAVLSFNEEGQEKLANSLSQAGQLSSFKDKLATGVVLGEKEIYVEDAILQVSQALDDLPITQYQEFKASFCADLVSQAQSATSSATP